MYRLCVYIINNISTHIFNYLICYCGESVMYKLPIVNYLVKQDTS